MLDWLVVGGGPHGVHAALRLIEDVGVPRDAVRILDDEQRLLARWRRSTRNTGMRFLRSPGVHHIGGSSDSLDRFANRQGRRVAKAFTRPYSRPALELFDLHCDHLIGRHRLRELHLRGRAQRLELETERARVVFEQRSEDRQSSEIEARHLVLAIGAPRRPLWPDWARRAADSAADCASQPSDRIRHVFDPGFELTDDENDETVAVIGGGITGAQVALRLAKPGRRVILLSRHELRVHQFDSDPGWQGPKNMASFSQLRDPVERRSRIREARHRGSMPPEVHSALRRAIAEGSVELVEGGDVVAANVSDREVALDLEGRRITADRVLLATGFPTQRPGGAWLDEAVDDYALPCAACGYPLVDRGLRWHPRLLVTGALAELELGPVSRNLSGARRAGDRLVAVARERLTERVEVATTPESGHARNRDEATPARAAS